jgi:hypothetical protein
VHVFAALKNAKKLYFSDKPLKIMVCENRNLAVAIFLFFSDALMEISGNYGNFSAIGIFWGFGSSQLTSVSDHQVTTWSIAEGLSDPSVRCVSGS